jgi:hypothetical protein
MYSSAAHAQGMLLLPLLLFLIAPGRKGFGFILNP